LINSGNFNKSKLDKTKWYTIDYEVLQSFYEEAEEIHVLYMSYRDEILKLKQNILDEEFYASCLRRYRLAEVLIIDDLFKGKINDSDINIMFEIVNYRYMNNLPIIEMCKDYVVEIQGKENNYRVNG